MALTVKLRDRVLLAGAEDRATLESDLSAEAGAYTDGQGTLLCPFCCPSGMQESDKLIIGIRTGWSFARPSLPPSARTHASLSH